MECTYNNGTKEYRVQRNVLFGFPLLWFTMSHSFLNPPYPGQTFEAIYSSLESAQKYLKELSNKNPIKIIHKKVIK